MASASGLINAANLVSFECYNGERPSKKSRAIWVPLDFSVGTIANSSDGVTTTSALIIDPTIAIDNDRIDFIQSLYVNNADNPNAISFAFDISRFHFTVPPNSQAFMSVLAPDSGTVTATTSGDYTGKVYVHLMNFPVANCIWKV